MTAPQITDFSKFTMVGRDGVYTINSWDYEITQPTEQDLSSEEDAIIWSEEQRQLNKSLALKSVENKFLSFCDLLSQSNTHTKLGFDQLQPILEGMMGSDPNTAIVLSVKLLAIDAEGKREGDNHWWDDCTWHPDIV
jgi:hypothetical protein